MESNAAAKLRSLRTFLHESPDRAVAADTPAIATLGMDLRCEVRGAGDVVVSTGVPEGLGGDASAPSPGWYLRCAIASCAATTIALRAAEAGLELESLEVTVDSTSDTRGLLGAPGIRPGMLGADMTVTVSAPGVSPADLERLVRGADVGSPVGESVRNGVEISTSIVNLSIEG